MRQRGVSPGDACAQIIGKITPYPRRRSAPGPPCRGPGAPGNRFTPPERRLSGNSQRLRLGHRAGWATKESPYSTRGSLLPLPRRAAASVALVAALAVAGFAVWINRAGIVHAAGLLGKPQASASASGAPSVSPDATEGPSLGVTSLPAPPL